MPHDERMLKTAYKPFGKGTQQLGGTMHRRGAGSSQAVNPFQNKNYDMRGMGMIPSELDRNANTELKYERQQRRWEMVLDKKHQNTDDKGKKQKESLAKKFKREKEVLTRDKEKGEQKAYDLDLLHGKQTAAKERKQTNDDKASRKRNMELKEFNKRAAAVSQRRLDVLEQRRTTTQAGNSPNMRGANESTSQLGENRASAHNLAPMKQRAFSSTGRTQG